MGKEGRRKGPKKGDGRESFFFRGLEATTL